MDCRFVEVSPNLGVTYNVRQGTTRFGRDIENDIQFLDDTVSRHHCKLVNLGHVCELTDEGSSNGTFVNGRLVDTVDLHDGDEVRVGETTLRFEMTGGESFAVDEHTQKYYTEKAAARTQVLRDPEAMATRVTPKPDDDEPRPKPSPLRPKSQA